MTSRRRLLSARAASLARASGALMMVVFAPHSSQGCRSSATHRRHSTKRGEDFLDSDRGALTLAVLARPASLVVSLFFATASFLFLAPIARADEPEPDAAAVVVRCPTVSRGVPKLAD